MTPLRLNDAQFSLAALIEYTTLCAILASLVGLIGLLPCVFLMGMALALGAGQGLLAFAMFMLASVAADASATTAGNDHFVARQILVLLIGGLVCLWYVARCRIYQAARRSAPESPKVANDTANQTVDSRTDSFVDVIVDEEAP